jgi:glycosyltransferase involved in cell wall biosynthesis
MISIIIPTRERADKINMCLGSILASDYKDFEVILVDQSRDLLTKKKLEEISNKKIRYFKILAKGLSRARNFGISKAKGQIIAFTDDDCLITKDWLENIYESFEKYPQVVCVAGNTLGFNQFSLKNKGKICPCIFEKSQKLITKPCFHAENIGYGNNMSFKKGVFAKVGAFNPYLGIGSLGQSAEDAEMFLRLLANGYKILHNPKMVVYHNRWLTKNEFMDQKLKYDCGELAVYGPYLFQGRNFAMRVVKNNLGESWKDSVQTLKSLKINRLKYLLKSFVYKAWGAVLGVYFAVRRGFVIN